MINSIFFYWAGWVFELAGVGLVALMVGEGMTEGAVPLFRRVAASLVIVFLVAAVAHACAWVMHSNDPFLFHTKAPRAGFWLELGSVFAPLLLWIPALRALPLAVLLGAATAVTPWFVVLFGHYFGVRF